MVTVTISETYDLHTEVNKMTLIGIHTPKANLIQSVYPGLCQNYRQFRIKSVSVALSTAQTLPLGVNEIGLDVNQIRPQDMMNPILYKACSNDSWNTLEYRLKGIIEATRTSALATPVMDGNMAAVEDDGVTGIADEHNVYYALLSDRMGWRIAHPQNGLRMRNLKPIVFERLYVDGINKNTPYETGETDASIVQNADSTFRYGTYAAGHIRGRGHTMPWLNTSHLTGISPGSGATPLTLGGMKNAPHNGQDDMPEIPPVMLGAIVLPPVTATTGILYYRMVCRAEIEFRGVRAFSGITTFTDMDSVVAPLVYHSDYPEQSKEMDATTNMVDVKNAEIEKIMEGR